MEEIKTEFEDENKGERALLTMVWNIITNLVEVYAYLQNRGMCGSGYVLDFSYLQSLNPGIDNSLSSYMNQRSKTGEFWKERWFVLNIITRTLVCYDNHLVRVLKYTCSMSFDGAYSYYILLYRSA